MKSLKVTMLSCTTDPIETLYLIWKQSRSEDPIPSTQDLRAMMQQDTKLKEEVEATVRAIMAARLPVAECIDFVFMLEHVTVSLREQLVRHRIGHRFGPRLGLDIIPGAIDSSFWGQTTRVRDMSSFANDENYSIPTSILEHEDPMLRILAQQHMRGTESLYRHFIEAGIPAEDARHVLPLAATHRIVWKANLAALMHLLARRSCWVAQLGLWKPVVHQLIKLLSDITPIFHVLALPPCMQLDQQGTRCWKGCQFSIDNQARAERHDPGVPCAIWMARQADEHATTAYLKSLKESPTCYLATATQQREEHEQLWGFTIAEEYEAFADEQEKIQSEEASSI